MRADGTKQRNLTESRGDVEKESNWSPDGRRISFASNRDGDDEVYTMRPDGSGVRQLTDNEGYFDGTANWSPDGRLLAFETHRDGNAEIYTIACEPPASDDPGALGANIVAALRDRAKMIDQRLQLLRGHPTWSDGTSPPHGRQVSNLSGLVPDAVPRGQFLREVGGLERAQRGARGRRCH